MYGRELFVKRYGKLGWNFRKVNPLQAIRINTMNANREAVVARLQSRRIELEQIPFLQDGYWIRRSRFSVGATAEYLLGLYSIQEAAAQIPVTLFAELKDKTVLDACAAPGGKTVQLANQMDNSGVVVALELKKRKMFALANQLERCRVTNTAVCNMDARKASELGMKFDCVLLDVPCSGNYVTDRDWFSKRTLQDVRRNARRQRQIISEAFKVTKIGGEIVYATCSLEPEENELNISWAIEKFPLTVEEINCFGESGLTNVFGRELDSSLAKCKRIWPEVTQGFFMCKLRKQGEIQ